jgi:hypothetical protein
MGLTPVSWAVLPADGAITNTKLANMAESTIKGRVSSGAGVPEDLSAAQVRTVLGITAAGAALIDDATAADQRTTLGLGTAATQASTAFEASGAVSTHAALTTGVHGAGANNVANTGANTFTGTQTIQAAATQDSIKIAGRAGGNSSYSVTITPLALSANRTRSEPDENGTYALRGANSFTGAQTIGTDPGGPELLRVGGTIKSNGALNLTTGANSSYYMYESADENVGIRFSGGGSTDILMYREASSSHIALAWSTGSGYTRYIRFYDTGGMYVGGTTEASDKDTGSIVTEGGIACEKDIFTGQRLRQIGCYAEIHIDDGSTAQSIATGTTYAKLTGIVSNGEAANCIADGTNSKITVTKTGRYRVSFNMSMTSGTNNVTYKAAIFWNGTEQHQIHAQTKLANGADSQHISASGIVRVTSATTDTDLRVRHDNGGSVNLTPVYANITVDYLGE